METAAHRDEGVDGRPLALESQGMGHLRVEAANKADAVCLCRALDGSTISHAGEH